MDYKKTYKKAISLKDNGNIAESNTTLLELYQEYPTKKHLLLHLALNYLDIEDWNEFIKFASNYLEVLDPKNKKINNVNTYWMLYHHLGVSYANLGNYERALEYFKSAIKVKLDDKSLLYAGEVCMNLGHDKQAISFWKTAAKMGNGEAVLALNTRGIDL